jgi:hypothetical protein
MNFFLNIDLSHGIFTFFWGKGQKASSLWEMGNVDQSSVFCQFPPSSCIADETNTKSLGKSGNVIPTPRFVLSTE